MAVSSLRDANILYFICCPMSFPWDYISHRHILVTRHVDSNYRRVPSLQSMEGWDWLAEFMPVTKFKVQGQGAWFPLASMGSFLDELAN